tara:strand:+ start:838 stop:1077 length:240 start_codon:yes stop_codon:yes gene_type:complete
MFKEMQREFLHAYTSMYDFLENINLENLKTDPYHEFKLTRVLALDRNSTSLEELGLSGAWIFHRLKNPIKMHRLVKRSD